MGSSPKLQQLSIINMEKHPSKYERIIKIRKDFREKQPEQEKAEQRIKDATANDDDIDF